MCCGGKRRPVCRGKQRGVCVCVHVCRWVYELTRVRESPESVSLCVSVFRNTGVLCLLCQDCREQSGMGGKGSLALFPLLRRLSVALRT